MSGKRSVRVTLYVHGTTPYNMTCTLAGWRDVPLSPLGKRQALKLKHICKDREYDAVFSSDLKRAYDTAMGAFGDRYRIIKDKRLREFNYGDFAGCSGRMLDEPKISSFWINTRFPNGECYKDAERRMRSFIAYLLKNYAGKHVAVVGHQAPQLSLEVLANRKTWEQAIRSDWRIKDPVRRKGELSGWRPGWDYVVRGR